MHIYIAFLRGINVGGQKKILMSDLRHLFEALGYSRVRTYIQSGNVIFSANSDISHATCIRDRIKEKYGWDVTVLIKTPVEIKGILAKCPFSEEKKVDSYFTLLTEAPEKALIADLAKIKVKDEEFLITKDCVYFYSSVGYGRTRFNNNFYEKKLKVKATARNYRTLSKLVELAQRSF